MEVSQLIISCIQKTRFKVQFVNQSNRMYLLSGTVLFFKQVYPHSDIIII